MQSAAASRATKPVEVLAPCAVSATPATRNEGEVVPRLRRKMLRHHGRHGRPSQSRPPMSAMSVIPTTRNNGGYEIVSRQGVWQWNYSMWVMVCDKVLEVSDGIRQSSVCVWSYCMWELCVCECVWSYCMLSLCVWSYRMWEMVCDKVVCVSVCKVIVC